MAVDLSLVRRAAERVERVQLRRWFRAQRMLGRKLDLKLDMSAGQGPVRAEATFTFVPQVSSSRMTCLIGEVQLKSVTWGDKQVKARVNSPYIVLSFPRQLEKLKEQRIVLRYTYVPDEQYTIQQPVTQSDCPERVWITVRRPFLGIVQGKLVEGREDPPLRIYQWEAPRCRKLSALCANVKTFKKDTPSGMAMFLHIQADETDLAPRILDLCVQLYEESADSHHKRLPFPDYHVLECDDPRMKPFNSPGMIVVPRGTFRVDDRPTVYGILAPEINKEWRRDLLRMVAEGKRD
jgi:hypothetical protein